MHLGQGVYVSNVATGEWTADPEVGGEMQVIVEVEGHYAGMSRFLAAGEPEAGPFRSARRSSSSMAPQRSRSREGRRWT